MPLHSTTLRGNASLRACLEHDAAHVTLGAKGPHVGLIQKCLLVLERSPISGNEMRTQTYGKTTAAAVLVYKRARAIINRSYQQQADNIVGKMTIARLDADIARVEQARTLLARCPQGSGGNQVLSVTAGQNVGAPASPRPQFRRALVIHLQRTELFTVGAEVLARELLARARALLSPFGMTLIEAPGLGGPPIPWPDVLVHTQFPPDRFALRKAAINTTAGDSRTLRVIFGPFDPVDNINGITDGGDVPGVQELVPKFVLINTLKRNPDSGTLLHELIHASFLKKSPEHDGDARSLYSVETARTVLSNEHATKLSEAFFSRSR